MSQERNRTGVGSKTPYTGQCFLMPAIGTALRRSDVHSPTRWTM